MAQKPVDNVSGKKHPNLAAAQRLSRRAYEKIVAAQQANEWDMDGHAAKAEDLLDRSMSNSRWLPTREQETTSRPILELSLPNRTGVFCPSFFCLPGVPLKHRKTASRRH